MKYFTLRLEDAATSQEIAQVSSFVGQDRSGSFGILPGHARMMASLVTGLARFRVNAGEFTYLATPGALLYFNADLLRVTTRHYFLDSDYMRIIQTLEQQLAEEEKVLQSTKRSLHRMEEEVLKRLWEMGRGAAG